MIDHIVVFLFYCFYYHKYYFCRLELPVKLLSCEQEITNSSLGNSLWQKYNVRLHTIHRCGESLSQTLRIAGYLLHQPALFYYYFCCGIYSEQSDILIFLHRIYLSTHVFFDETISRTWVSYHRTTTKCVKNWDWLVE